MSVFVDSIDALYESELALDAVYTPSGGPGVGVRVIPSRGLIESPLGRTDFRLAPSTQAKALTAQVRVSEVASPSSTGATLAIEGLGTYSVKSPELVEHRLAWLLTLGKLA